uniref:Homeobox domain-containing protein n=1 Tax=Caenorhabditis tropicalis TaxID=1561998 RepID=A0A1I7USN4_9PELO
MLVLTRPLRQAGGLPSAGGDSEWGRPRRQDDRRQMLHAHKGGDRRDGLARGGVGNYTKPGKNGVRTCLSLREEGRVGGAEPGQDFYSHCLHKCGSRRIERTQALPTRDHPDVPPHRSPPTARRARGISRGNQADHQSRRRIACDDHTKPRHEGRSCQRTIGSIEEVHPTKIVLKANSRRIEVVKMRLCNKDGDLFWERYPLREAEALFTEYKASHSMASFSSLALSRITKFNTERWRASEASKKEYQRL